MTSWQARTAADLAERLPGAAVEPYGSSAGGGVLDGWSDLDVRIRLPRSVPIERGVDADLWAWQESASADGQRLRLVLADGRRIDAVVTGAVLLLPDPPPDCDVRFDAALAAVRLGRGSALIGLHLLLGVCRAALVQSMLVADARAGSSHHPAATPFDGRAAEVAALLGGALTPETARDAYALYGRRRAEAEPGYAPDPTGLDAVIERGRRAAD